MLLSVFVCGGDWASENLSGRVQLEGHLPRWPVLQNPPRWQVLQNFSFQPCLYLHHVLINNFQDNVTASHCTLLDCCTPFDIFIWDLFFRLDEEQRLC